MSGTFSREHSFRRGCFGRQGRILFGLVNDALAKEGSPHSLLVLWDNGKFRPVATVGWNLCAIVCVDWQDTEYVVIGERGEMLSIDAHGGTADFGRLGAGNGALTLRGASVAGGDLHVVGAGHRAFTVDPHGVARDISPDAGTVERAGGGVGLEAVSGFSAADLYAVGWEGQILRFDGNAWHVCPSPTNLILSSVLCAPTGEVWAAGQMGTIVCGRVDEWRVIDSDTTDSIWSLSWYADGLIYATSRELFRIDAHAGPGRIGLDADPSSFHWLDAAKGRFLLSTGAKDVVLVSGDRELRID